jgi:putative ABC transport system permease protein
MRTRLAAQSSVISVSGSGMNLGLGKDGSTSTIGTCFGYKEKIICGQVMIVDNEILRTLSITPTGGRDFSLDYTGDSSTAVILTESYARQFSEKNIVGLSFYSDSSRPKWNVVGVIPDFKLYSMYEKKEPLILLMEKDRSIAYVLIKVNTANPSATMKMISSVYAEVEPGTDFKGSFVNENIERWYKSEQRLAMLFSVAAMVAIVLSCMGLFGIAFIIIRQRVKEIGVRKVLGASVRNITTLVTQEFVRPVLVALPIAIPIAWLAMNKWLQNFSYRVAIHWWVFVVAGFTAMLIALATVGFQAIKAAVANPVDSLRNE